MRTGEFVDRHCHWNCCREGGGGLRGISCYGLSVRLVQQMRVCPPLSFSPVLLSCCLWFSRSAPVAFTKLCVSSFVSVLNKRRPWPLQLLSLMAAR